MTTTQDAAALGERELVERLVKLFNEFRKKRLIYLRDKKGSLPPDPPEHLSQEAEAQAILQALPVALTGWRPIAEAPKDGTYILVSNGQYVDVTRWSHGCFGGFARPDDATHWMPLPAAPQPPLTAEEKSNG